MGPASIDLTSILTLYQWLLQAGSTVHKTFPKALVLSLYFSCPLNTIPREGNGYAEGSPQHLYLIYILPTALLPCAPRVQYVICSTCTYTYILNILEVVRSLAENAGLSDTISKEAVVRASLRFVVVSSALLFHSDELHGGGRGDEGGGGAQIRRR